MKLYGLKDEQGRDVELVISDEGHPHHHVLRVEVVERTCEFCKHNTLDFEDFPCGSCIDALNFER